MLDEKHPVKCLKCGYRGQSGGATVAEGQGEMSYLTCPQCGEMLMTDFSRFKADQFPRYWNCPKCGSDERTTQLAFKQSHNGLDHHTYSRMQLLNLSSLELFWDVCWQCGTEYIYEAKMPPSQLKVQAQRLPDQAKRIIVPGGGNN